MGQGSYSPVVAPDGERCSLSFSSEQGDAESVYWLVFTTAPV